MALENKKFLLGAKDPEMDMIEDRIIKPLGLQYHYAEVDGMRVHPGNAYQANNDLDGDLVYIECSLQKDGFKIDHHRPGDPGYGIGAEDFMNASSIGQLIRYLLQHDIGVARIIEGVPLDSRTKGNKFFHGGEGRWIFPSMQHDIAFPEDFVYQAAADHCLAAGYAGKCPGIDKVGLRALQAKNISKTTEVSIDEALDAIKNTENMFTPERQGMLGRSEHLVYDFTDLDLGVGYSLHYLALKEAGTMMGRAYLVAHRFSARAPKTLMLNSASEAEVNYFLDNLVPEMKLQGKFGSSSRGYAGGNIPD
tara:strand:+ start:19082 stop:20002 length:921 start_codon:yes stop_codon:yes gene_type:complete